MPRTGVAVRLARAVWTARGAAVAAWLAVAAGSLYADALASADAGFRTAVSVGLWVGFAAALAGLLLPGPLALTAVRAVVPANLAASLWALAVVDDRAWLGHGIAVAAAAAAAVAVLHPAFGDAVTDASSYGAERRFLLRAPGPVLITLVAPMWLLACAGAAAGPLLLADRRWPAGAAALAVGLPVSAVAGRALHRLARRWLVFVPAGLVVHDHLTLSQPVLLTRSEIASVGPASADAAGGAADLTAAALGLALEIRLTGRAELPVTTGRNRSREQAVEALLVSPSLPARVLAAAADRGLPVSASRDG